MLLPLAIPSYHILKFKLTKEKKVEGYLGVPTYLYESKINNMHLIQLSAKSKATQLIIVAASISVVLLRQQHFPIVISGAHRLFSWISGGAFAALRSAIYHPAAVATMPLSLYARAAFLFSATLSSGFQSSSIVHLSCKTTLHMTKSTPTHFPELIVFDLDACLWDKEMYELSKIPDESNIVKGDLGHGRGEGVAGIMSGRSKISFIKVRY